MIGRGLKSPALHLLVLLIIMVAFSACTPAPIYTSGTNRTKPARPKNKQPEKKEKTPSIKEAVGSMNEEFEQGKTFIGVASYYGPGFHGKLTANGETFDQNDMTCAHKTLPFNTILEVTLLDNGKSVTVRVNDRGPYIPGRVLDLSVEAARRLGLTKMGTGRVAIEIVELGG